MLSPFHESLHQFVEIRVSGAEPPRQPVPAALGDRPTVRDHLELALRSGYLHDVDAEMLFDEGHETRDLGLVVVSGRAVDDFYLLHDAPSSKVSPCSDVRGVAECRVQRDGRFGEATNRGRAQLVVFV